MKQDGDVIDCLSDEISASKMFESVELKASGSTVWVSKILTHHSCDLFVRDLIPDHFKLLLGQRSSVLIDEIRE